MSITLQEVRFKYMNLGAVGTHLLREIDGEPRLAAFLGLDTTKPLNKVIMSVSRLIASQPFVVVQEDVAPVGNGGLAILNIALARSKSIAHPQRNQTKSDSGQVHSFDSKGQTGIPLTSMLRIRETAHPFTIHHATLRIEASQGEGDDGKSATKNMYFAADFLRNRTPPDAEKK